MDLNQDESRGIEAERVLHNPIFKEAFQIIEERLVNELSHIEIKPERAEYVRQLLVMGRKYRAYIEQVMVTGRMAAEQKSLIQRAKEAILK